MKRLSAVLSVIVIILVPVFLITTSVRLWATPLYPQVEYNMPYFPADPYGFTKQDRLKWTGDLFAYTWNNAGPEYLSDLRFDSGQPVFNEREVSHMVDVKNLAQAMMRVWIAVTVLLVGMGLLAWRTGWLSRFWRGISAGGWATIGFVIFILVAVAVSFQSLFTDFHRIFFTGDTWVFEWSDTLIRLLPLTFWRDTFIVVGALTFIGSGLCIFFGNRFSKGTA